MNLYRKNILAACIWVVLAGCSWQHIPNENRVTVPEETNKAISWHYSKADMVAHIRIRNAKETDRTLSDDGKNGYANVLIEADIIEVFKGIKRDRISFSTGADIELAPFNDGFFQPDSKWLVFLDRLERESETIYVDLENSQESPTTGAINLLRKLQR